MNEKVQVWLKRLVGSEGGYSNRNPKDDPGGETKWGISKRAYPKLDIKNLTVEHASQIYIRDYLTPFINAKLSDSTVFQMLDFAVNSGVVGATKVLQKELKLVSDGVLGPKSIAKILATSESDLVMLVTAARLDFMAGLKNWDANSKGWAHRLAQNLRYGAEDTD